MKKTIAILLAAVLLLGMLCACGEAPEETAVPDDAAETPAPEVTPSPAPEVTETPEVTYAEGAEPVTRDFAALKDAFPADTVMLTVNGKDVKWSELFFWITDGVNMIDSEFGAPVQDFNVEYITEPSLGTNAEAVLTYAVNAVSQYRALDTFAEKLGAELSQESLDGMEQQLMSDMSAVGTTSEETFEAMLAIMNMNRDIYDYMNRSYFLVNDCFVAAYGAAGEKCTDAEALAYAEENEYIRVKHILISTLDEEGNPLPDEELAAKRDTADAILKQLQDASDREAKIDELMTQSDDPGSTYYPDGYVFTHGKMVPSFEQAAYSLADGEVSGVVVSDYGFHIILRLPMDIDAAVQYVSADEAYSVRYYAANAIFNERLNAEVDGAAVEYMPEYGEIDLQTLLNGK